MSNDIFSFTERLPTNEAWKLGGSVTALGVAVVFVALVLLIVMTILYPKFFGWLLPKSAVIKSKMANKKAARQLTRLQRKEAAKATIIAVDKAQETSIAAAPLEDSALIAVITAAIAASLGTSSNGIRIKSLRRSSVSTPAWGREGRYEQFRY